MESQHCIAHQRFNGLMLQLQAARSFTLASSGVTLKLSLLPTLLLPARPSLSRCTADAALSALPDALLCRHHREGCLPTQKLLAFHKSLKGLWGVTPGKDKACHAGAPCGAAKGSSARVHCLVGCVHTCLWVPLQGRARKLAGRLLGQTLRRDQKDPEIMATCPGCTRWGEPYRYLLMGATGKSGLSRWRGA